MLESDDRGCAGCLSHRHTLPHAAHRCVGVMIGRKTASGDQQSFCILRDQASVRDVIGFSIRQVFPAGILPGVVFFDRRPALGNGILELAGSKHILTGQAVFAKDSATLAYPNLVLNPPKAAFS